MTEPGELSSAAALHPEEMNASVHVRVGSTVSLQPSARATPAGLAAMAVQEALVAT